jgi:putative component of membrane protein insertase Oxa1/YidC/SpoIIIJ protein YidD
MISRAAAIVLSILFLLFSEGGLPSSALGSDLAMKGPREKVRHQQNVDQAVETSCVKLVFLGAIGLYQKRVSSSGGPDRCGFRPSCSAYGYTAIEEEGPVIGLLMTADRLTRCNLFKGPGPDYTLLPNGKLYDPPSKNLLFDR